MKARLVIVVDAKWDSADLDDIKQVVADQVGDTVYVSGTTGESCQWSCTVEEASVIDE